MIYMARWKQVVVVTVCLLGMFFAFPNVLSREQADKMPSWWQPVTLGLDLQGGSHLLLEVDFEALVRERLVSLVDAIRNTLRQEKSRILYTELGVKDRNVTVRVTKPEDRDRAFRLLRSLDPEVSATIDENGLITFALTEQGLIARRNSAMEQSLEIVRRRIDELGTREPSIQRQGENRIVIQLPGLKDPTQIKKLLGQTAKLTFHLVDYSTSVADAMAGKIPPGSELLPMQDPEEGQILIKRRVEVGGDSLVDSQPTKDSRSGQWAVSTKFDASGAKAFAKLTSENVDRQFAIVLDGKVISAPRVNEPIIGGSGIITGRFTSQEATDLSALLRAGALPAPLKVLEERTVGPDLGGDSIQAGAIACIVGFVFVVVFMIAAYAFFGIIADIALLINLILLVACLSILGATLTLPGIAGIVLTMGMAVDANVLIYERIREEYRAGRTVLSAIDAGFSRALTTILDSNLTTLMAAGLLAWLGAGPVRGFAVTLTLGLLTSMFTAITVTRLMLIVWLKTRNPKTLSI